MDLCNTKHLASVPQNKMASLQQVVAEAADAARPRPVSIRTETIQTNVGDIDADFAGRMGSSEYDESRIIHIHRRNRAYVWDNSMCRDLLDSMCSRYYIPPIIAVEFVTPAGVRRYIVDGGNRVTSFRRLLRNEVKTLTDEEHRAVVTFPITLVVMRGLTSTDQRLMFRRINKNKSVSNGQLYAMSADDSPLVQEALALLNDRNHPLRDSITRNFYDTVGLEDDTGRNALSNAVAIIAGAMWGPTYIRKDFDTIDEKLDKAVNRDVINTRLSIVFDIFDQASAIEPQLDGRRQRGQWASGRYIGAIIYDLHMCNGNIGEVQSKWIRYLVSVRRNEVDAEDALVVPGASGSLNPTKLARMSFKVGVYVRDHRIATRDEVKAVVYRQTGVDDDDDSVDVE